MKIDLKRNKALCPIIFTLPENKDKNVVCLSISHPSTNWVNSTEALFLYIDESISDFLQYCRIANSRSTIYRYHRIYGGTVLDEDRLVALIVTNPEGKKFVIVEKEFSEEYISSFAKVKKSMNLLGISSRSRLVLATRDEIFTTFQQKLNPTMEDYNDETQLKLSSEFINKRKNERKKEINFN